MKQLLIPIQSFSNIITNSSSEIFCIIKGDKETILFINNLLFNLLGKNVYDEDSPMYELLCKSDLDKDDYDEEQCFEIFGLKLHFDDLLIIALLFFLYQEEVKDTYLYISLILLLLS